MDSCCLLPGPGRGFLPGEVGAFETRENPRPSFNETKTISI